jgi:predicted acylesterase/phospholipase RssA
MQKIAISVGGGGDKTFFFAGVIYYLKKKFDIVEIFTVSGSSYSIPLTYDASTIGQATSNISKFDLLSYMQKVPRDQILERRGLVEFDKDIFGNLEVITKIKRGSAHKPIISPIAVDINNKRTVRLNNIRFGVAAAGSFSFPLFIAPLNYHNLSLLDGGLTGNVNLMYLEKYKNIPTVALELDFSNFDQSVSGLYDSMKLGMKRLDMNATSFYDLYKLIKHDKFIMKLIKGFSYRSRGTSNFMFTLTGLSSGLILNTRSKVDLFMKGYLAGEHVYTKMDYYISSGVWKQVQNLNSIININEI